MINPGDMYRARINVDSVQRSLGTFATLIDAWAALAIARAENAPETFMPTPIRRSQLKAERASSPPPDSRCDARTVRELAGAWLSWQESCSFKLGSVYTYRRLLEDTKARRGHPGVPRSGGPDQGGHRRRHRTAPHVHPGAAEFPGPAAGPSPHGPAPTHTRDREPLTDADLFTSADLMPPADRLAVLLSRCSALRIGEALALRRRHVSADLDGTT